VHEEVKYAKPKPIIAGVVDIEEKITSGLKNLLKKVE